jgi:hypothetical protein
VGLAKPDCRRLQDRGLPGAHGRPAEQTQLPESDRPVRGDALNRFQQRFVLFPKSTSPIPRFSPPFYSPREGRYMLTAALNARYFSLYLKPTISLFPRSYHLRLRPYDFRTYDSHILFRLAGPHGRPEPPFRPIRPPIPRVPVNPSKTCENPRFYARTVFFTTASSERTMKSPPSTFRSSSYAVAA